jgi:hypothetical protein
MSNFLAIATVTATLQRILQLAVEQDVAGATVVTTRPSATIGATPQHSVSLFLYQVNPNPAWRNVDLPTRRSDGQTTLQRPQAALDLHYLIIFNGDEGQLEPQRLLGSIVRTMHVRPVLSRDLIRSTIGNPSQPNSTSSFPFLADSDLAEQVEMVRFTPVTMSLEELSKVWSVFFETPYALSVAYQASVVLIDADETPVTPLPVRKAQVTTVTLRHPEITAIQSNAGPNVLIDRTSAVAIIGRQLKNGSAGGTQVRIDQGASIPANSARPDRLEIDLSKLTLTAGIHSIQVWHPINIDYGNNRVEPRGGFESNAAAFVLHPTIDTAGANGGIDKTGLTSGADGSSGDLVARVSPQLRAGQRVILLLNEYTDAAAPTNTALAAYSFAMSQKVAPDSVTSAANVAMSNVTFHVAGVKSGKYLVRVRVDGADTLLETDSTQPTFGPKAVIP